MATETPSGVPFIDDNVFLVFDLETTGVDVTSDLPVSYSILTYLGSDLANQLYSVVYPGLDIPAEASAIHGISTDVALKVGSDLRDGLYQVVLSLLRASRDGWYVVGMNVAFDLSMVNFAAKKILGESLIDYGFNAPVIDTLVLDRYLEPYRKGRRNLDALCMRYKVTGGGFHNALEDTKMTFGVLVAMLKEFPSAVDMLEAKSCTDTMKALHEKWLTGYNDYLVRSGKDEIAYHGWPISTQS
ncbi:MAG: exonuclease domain-containing protein [Actinomycetota bacterium]|nr:exonuclease domain-containing protein [Actinomycetota bacterium]